VNDSPAHLRLTWWSLITVVLAIPVWSFIAMRGVITRDLDGGLFLSIVGGMERGLTLYSEVFDVKDPLFFGTMFAAHRISPAGPFVLDWLWILLAAFGGWLLARTVTTPDRALAVGLVAVPLVLVGGFHAPGHTNTPGTALTLLGLGFVLNRRGVLGGIVLGLVLFTKALVWPLGLVAVLALLLIPSWRQTALRTVISGAGTVAVVALLLQLLGILGPYIEVLRWNSAYSFTIMEYFGYESSLSGHFTRLAEHWTMVGWLGVSLVALVAIALILRWSLTASWRTAERSMLTLWLPWVTIGTLGIIGLSYVWQHHAQLVYLPAALAVVAVAAVLPDRWPFLVALPIVLVASWLMGAWGTPADGWSRVVEARDTFPARWAEIDEVPKDARLLSSVPLGEFTYARLGTNDDRGYLLSAPDNASLACPQFHFYDFSPDEDFMAMLECIQGVDVVLLTDNFVVFGNGGKAPVVQPILQYVQANFECLRVDDRQVCTRRPV
jgi:hypothetical protein